MDIFEFAKESKDILKPFWQTDVLLYYGIVVPSLFKYLKGKEIAAKNYLGKDAFSDFFISNLLLFSIGCW